MQGCNVPEGSSVSVGSVVNANAWFELPPKCKTVSDYKPKMNITLGGSTYTKTIDLESQDFFNLPEFGSFGSGTNGPDSSQVNESLLQNNGQIIQSSVGYNEQKTLSNVESNHYAEISGDYITKTPEKSSSASRSTFFSRLARRLTIRRTVPKLNSVSPPHGNANSLKSVVERSSPQIPTGRKIRRWLSKHLMPPPKNSLHKAPPSHFSTRAATLDGAVDKCVSQPADDFGSAPTRRRALPLMNLSGSSLCNSQTGTVSLADEPLEAGMKSTKQKAFSYGSRRLNSIGAAASASVKRDNPAAQISSAFSSPSVTGIGPPPRYLNVSLAAFGYTGCNRRWVSVQTLERGKTPTAEQASPSAFPEANVAPHHNESTSPASSPRTVARRPYRLDIHDGQNFEVLPIFIIALFSMQLSTGPVYMRMDSWIDGGFGSIEEFFHITSSLCRIVLDMYCGEYLASPAAQAPVVTPAAVTEHANSSGVAIRVKRNCSNVTSVTTSGEGDQSQDLNRSHHSHHEHWNRSSLIMLAVAQASPRRRRLVCGEESTNLDVPLPKVEEVPSMNTTDNSQEEETAAATMGLEEAASSFALVNGHGLAKNEEETVTAVVTMKEEQSDEVKDGHYFLRVAEDTAQELRSRVEKIEHDLSEHEFSEEVSGHLRTTVGKVNLLLSQKFPQFRGLCMDSIEAARVSDSAGDFVTLPSDLEGFWAMVMLQVNDVRSMIAECDRLRQNDWRIGLEPSSSNDQNSCLQTPSKTKRRQLKTAVSPATMKSRQNKEAAELARSQARERLKAAKRQYMRARQDECTSSINNSSSSNNVFDNESSTFLVL
ncbi:unnamed protein product [Hydatigera taeniaeformis]|uniref:Uncharacterized protein n=1 Tax=Hydatigena taeniaeformis TaxID=6205 RepID=A0A158RF58_HYDTA|nr:unnamed protein product [Hydatigera taeniaeformis]